MASVVTMTTEEKVLCTVEPVTEGGSPAPIDGVCTWQVVSGTCTVEPVDATSAYIVSGAAPGASVVEVSADADLDTGVMTVTSVINVTVNNPSASSLTIVMDEPILK
jgi:hypothetical protein